MNETVKVAFVDARAPDVGLGAFRQDDSLRGPLEILVILTCVLGWDILPKFFKAGIATLM